ncbi:MAG: NAD-dependent epimerase/dehydratase family protein [Hyphomicrobiales bacterium]|nr:NAD-dependent epimerase/dehydratase family protein [Hyphomicrobiales bacterium]
MTYLITGAAGFIGFHTSLELLARGEKIIGIDNLNDYYSPDLKKARLEQLKSRPGFEFHLVDIAEKSEIDKALKGKPIRHIIHLAAQAGVRYSIENPASYVRSNLVGHANMLEFARNLDGLVHMAYASSSSVYGGRTDLPFLESDRCDKPVSLYAATKKSGELMSHTYSHLYGIPLTGLRFFTVYGPWGRPDMAYWSFTRDIEQRNTIHVFNNGDMLRDFTYIDDIVSGVRAIMEKGHVRKLDVPHFVYNIGNNHPERLEDFIAILEELLGKKAIRQNLPMQPGDVPATFADISAISEDYGFKPTTDLRTGLQKYVKWYRGYNQIK